MIGIFDSGVGGLSVFREIKKLLPEEKYIYFSDNAHCPYGEKSKEYIIDRARQITDFIISSFKRKEKRVSSFYRTLTAHLYACTIKPYSFFERMRHHGF